MKRFARSVGWVVQALLAIGFAQDSSGQSYPTRPVRVISGFAPGSPDDFIARLISERFQATFKQPWVVENRTGAGGNIAAEIVAKSPPDGYTLLAVVDTTVTVNPHIYKRQSFNPAAELVPVMYVAKPAGQTLVCNSAVPVKSVAEFISYAKANPLSYASGGAGVPGHLSAELFIAATGIKMTHVPYKGPSPATQDILAGLVPCGFLATPVVVPHVRSGKLRGLAVSSATRSTMAPELPTMIEAGVPGYDAAFGQIHLAPKGTPEPVLEFLSREVGKILQEPEIRARMLAVDLDYVPNTPAEAAARVREASAKWKQVIERIGLQVD